jgi:peptidoglycan/xylan/chitin deacetylase (PgdA/CDA1 family)
VTLTFDDGNANNCELLLPIVERLRIPVTIYVATAQVESGQCFWFDRVINAVQTSRRISIDLSHHGLGRFTLNAVRGARNWAEIDRLLEALKPVSSARREALTDEIIDQIGEVPHPTVRPLSIDQLQRLSASPYVTIGSHTHGHDLLTQISTKEARQTIVKSCELLRRWTGRAVRDFAYPNGDFNPDIVALAEQLGFRSAMAAYPGAWRPQHGTMRIPRLSVGRYDSLDRFRFNLLGAGSGLSPLLLRRKMPRFSVDSP